MYEDVLQRIKELYRETANHNWMHLDLYDEFENADAALAYLKARKKIAYVRIRDGRTVIRPIKPHKAS